MRIVTRKALEDFWKKHRDSEQPLKAWFAEAIKANWKGPADIKARYPKASILPGDRVVFDILGGNYRLIVHIHYKSGIVFIRFVGTHRQYDHVDAEII